MILQIAEHGITLPASNRIDSTYKEIHVITWAERPSGNVININPQLPRDSESVRLKKDGDNWWCHQVLQILLIKIYVGWSDGRSFVLDEVCDAACCGVGWTGEWLSVGHIREIFSFHSNILSVKLRETKILDSSCTHWRCAGHPSWAQNLLFRRDTLHRLWYLRILLGAGENRRPSICSRRRL